MLRTMERGVSEMAARGLDDRDLAMLKGIMEALAVARDISNMPLAELQTFLFIAHNEGCTQTAVAQALKMQKAMVNRYIQDLRDNGPPTYRKWGFVRVDKQYDNMREDSLTITPKGRVVLKDLAKTLEKHVARA